MYSLVPARDGLEMVGRSGELVYPVLLLFVKHEIPAVGKAQETQLLHFSPEGIVPLIAGVVAAMEAPPLVEDPWTFSSATMDFSYPGNWSVLDWHEDHDPTANVRVEPLADAWTHIVLGESDRGIEDLLAVSRGSVSTTVPGAVDGPTFDDWGCYEGQGLTVFGTRRGVPYVARIFVSALGEGRFLEIQEVFAAADEVKLSPGFELIRSTFMVKSI